MALSEECKGRLHNWKFEQARKLLGGSEPTMREGELVKALAEAFGDVGWFRGGMSIIVCAAVSAVIGEDAGRHDTDAGNTY